MGKGKACTLDYYTLLLLLSAVRSVYCVAVCGIGADNKNGRSITVAEQERHPSVQCKHPAPPSTGYSVHIITSYGESRLEPAVTA